MRGVWTPRDQNAAWTRVNVKCGNVTGRPSVTRIVVYMISKCIQHGMHSAAATPAGPSAAQAVLDPARAPTRTPLNLRDKRIPTYFTKFRRIRAASCIPWPTYGYTYAQW